MRKYSYSKPVFLLSVIFPVFFMIGLLIWSIIGFIQEGPSALYKLIMISMPFLILSTVIGLQNPASITVTPESIIFEGFGRKHHFQWDEIDLISVKDYGYVGKSFIRVGKYRPLIGRYWISNQLQGYRELVGILQTKMGS